MGDYYDKYYKQLEGFKISKFLGITEEDDMVEGFPRFLLTKPGFESVVIEVSQDPEGNGPGFLFIGDVEQWTY